MGIYWGDLHGYSRFSDGRPSPDDHYKYGRDTANLDFCALTDHIGYAPSSKSGLMSKESWEKIKQATNRFNAPGRFVTLVGFERSVPSWDGPGPGSICIYYKGDDASFPQSEHPQRDWIRPGAIRPQAEMRRIWDELKGVKCLKAIIHSNSARHGFTWAKAPPEYKIDLIEVYSKWGATECPAAPFPVLDGTGHGPRPGGSAHDALRAGFTPGFLAGSGTHFGMPGGHVWENDWANAARYDKSGLTAVYAEELSRAAVFDALKERRCYATTGERIKLVFTINDHPMGDVITASGNLRVHVRALGTREIKRAEVFRNGEIIHHKIGGREELEMYFDEGPPAEPAWYYVRVTQFGEDYAWSSPIWVKPGQE